MEMEDFPTTNGRNKFELEILHKRHEKKQQDEA